MNNKDEALCQRVVEQALRWYRYMDNPREEAQHKAALINDLAALWEHRS